MSWAANVLTSQGRIGGPQSLSLGGGTPARGRKLGAQGRQRVRSLLEAGLAEFRERGFQTVRVDDIVRRAQSSHGTFYLYFASKDDLFKTLLRDALRDIRAVTGDFPVVTRNRAGRDALRVWVQRYCDTYAMYGPIMRMLSQEELVGAEAWGYGVQTLFGLAEAVTTGMTVASRWGTREQGGLTALACVLMLERVNYLLSAGVEIPADGLADSISSIIDAAFDPSLMPSAEAPSSDDSRHSAPSSSGYRAQPASAGPLGGSRFVLADCRSNSSRCFDGVRGIVRRRTTWYAARQAQTCAIASYPARSGATATMGYRHRHHRHRVCVASRRAQIWVPRSGRADPDM